MTQRHTLETLSPLLKLPITSYLGLFVLFPIKFKFVNILQLYVMYSDECIVTLLLLMISCCVCVITCFPIRQVEGTIPSFSCGD